MFDTFAWRDLAPCTRGGRRLSNALRFLLLAASLGSGMAFGEIIRFTIM